MSEKTNEEDVANNIEVLAKIAVNNKTGGIKIKDVDMLLERPSPEIENLMDRYRKIITPEKLRSQNDSK